MLLRLAAAVPAGDLTTDPAELDYFSHDVYSAGERPLAVLIPSSVAMLQAALRAMEGTAVPFVPRGGGMSYTGGYLAI